MSNVETVEDPEDPRLTDYREIRDAERRRRSGTFIAEGRQGFSSLSLRVKQLLEE